ncbi:MAG: N-acetylneuraminate synthase family protein [archaeon]
MVMSKIDIGNRKIGPEEPCFIIMDAGVNHNGSMELAKKLVDAAKEAGVDAVKFQTFKSEKIVTAKAEQAEYQTKNIGKKESQYDMLKRLELSYEDFEELKRYCDEKGIIFLSTPHSCKEDVDLIAKLCPAIKVGSGDLTNIPILKYMAQKGLPIFLATGMSFLSEVEEAVLAIIPTNRDLVLLHCTTNYPTPLNEVNLQSMMTMHEAFKLPVGYSDHTEGIIVSVAAAAMGACLVEKHLTLDKKMEGPDHKASLEPDEAAELVKQIRKVEKMLKKKKSAEEILLKLMVPPEIIGDGVKKPMASEYAVMKVARKSVVAAKDIKKGSIITEKMLEIKRPGDGLHPREYFNIIGKTAKNSIKKDSLLKLADIK